MKQSRILSLRDVRQRKVSSSPCSDTYGTHSGSSAQVLTTHNNVYSIPEWQGESARENISSPEVRTGERGKGHYEMDQRSQLTDNQLVEAVQRGDKRAFDMLVIKYQAKVAGVISRFITDHSEVLDVSQEAFVKAYRALNQFRGDSAFYTWIYRIAINTAKNYLVSKGRRPPGVDVDVSDAEFFELDTALRDVQSPDRILQRDELAQTVHRAMSALPEDLRVALALREFDGLSYEEIAEIMACPVGTVRSRIFRAREAVDTAIAPLL